VTISTPGLRTRAGALLATGLCAATLTACNKPEDKISILSGKTVSVVSPFTGDAKQLCNAGSTAIKDITAVGGSSVLIDVPKKVANAGWFVSAFIVNSSCQAQAVAQSATQGTKSHALRVSIPQANEGSFFLQVVPLTGSDSKTTWLVRVNLTQ